MMKVVILCGGQGTRLREETEYKPKPMMRIGGKPILWHIMKHYATFGFKNFILCLGYQGDVIRDYFLNFAKHESDLLVRLGQNEWTALGQNNLPDWNITLAETGLETMTGGRLLRVKKYVGNESFLLTYGDAVCSVDLRELLDFHQKNRRLATVTGVPPLPRFGELEVDASRVISFNEKPSKQLGVINGGYFVFEPEIFSYLENDETILERAPFERLAKDDQMRVFRHDGFWQCMDTYRDFKTLNHLWDSNQRHWAVWEKL